MRSSILLLLAVLSFTPLSRAEKNMEIQPFEFPREWRLEYPEVQVVNQNPEMGLQFYAHVRFEKWQDLPSSDLSEAIVIGLTRSGQLYHLVDIKGRRVMRLLSGTRKIRDFLLAPDGNILAVDAKGDTLLFDAGQWMKSPVEKLVRTGMVRWGLSSLALVATTGWFLPEQMHQQMEAFLLMNGLGSVAIALNTALMSLNRYDFLNQRPDGFVAVDAKWNPRELATMYPHLKIKWSLRGPSGFIVSKCREIFQRPTLRPSLSEKTDIR